MNPDGMSSDPLLDGDLETLCAHYGEHRLAFGGSVPPPLYQASTFLYPDAEAFERRLLPQSPYFDYTRHSNPTTAIYEAKLAKLEKGHWARAYGSGMGAITAVVNCNLRAGSHVVAVANCYPPTHEYLDQYLPRFDIATTFVNGTNYDDYLNALQDNTRLIYLESPTWGRYGVIDLGPIVSAARERGILTVLDNSWATPLFQNPLELGCDLVVHSATKYLGGHSDLLGGIVVGRDTDLQARIARESTLLGSTMDPFAAWLLLRSLRTLPVRMERHQATGLALARMLAEHPAVETVDHPGLETHPSHAVARKQMRGFAGVFGITLKDPSREAAYRVVNRLRIFHIGVSWGGFESLAIAGTFFDRHPDRHRWHIRLHAGLESENDLLADLRQALEE